ncbi:MAG TPA: hypothetical protein VLD67_15180 [Vicinamibacterales bacterium]|nr:hypothetical protein [Vicinamibacterales bacterium]
MGRFILALIVGLLLGGVVVSTEPSDQGKKKQKAERTNPDRGSDARVAVHVVFATGDVAVLRHHYAPRYRNLPPGLQKKVSRGGALPPGWQKKFEPFPTVVERELRPLPDGYRRGVIDGHAVIFDSRTKVVVDVAVLF